MTDDEIIGFLLILGNKSKEEVTSICVKKLLEIELLKEEIESLKKEILRPKSVNKVGPAKTKDIDEAFRMFAVAILATLEKKEPGCIPTDAEWYKIVGDPKVKWQFESMKKKKAKVGVRDDLELLPNGLGKDRAKRWYYNFQKRVKNAAARQALLLDPT